MAAEQFANLAATTLNGAINNAVTTVVVASGAAPFPSSAQFRIVVDSEIMLVTAGAGTASWTVTRGAESTTAASHADGAAVTHVLTAGALGVVSDPSAAVPGLRTLGTGATQAAGGTDSRLSDSRAPNGSAGGHLTGTYPSPSIASGVVTSSMIVDGTIVDADINSAAAIANTKLATNPLARANHTGTQTMSTISDAGSLATKNAIASADITDGTVVDADINASAAIAKTKVSGTAITAADTGTVTSTMILDGTILNADVNASAAIAVSKLAAGNNGEVVKTVNGGVVSSRPQNYFKLPTSGIAETFSRAQLNASTALTSATLYLFAIELDAGQVISNINVRNTATAMATGTNQWFGLYDSSRVQLATTSDAAAAVGGWTGNITVTLPIATIASGASSTYTVLTSGLYYVGFMVKATTMPTVGGFTTIAQSTAPILAGSSSTAQAAPNAFPFTAAALTAITTSYHMWVS